MKARFLEKGYKESNIDDTIRQVANIDRKTMLTKQGQPGRIRDNRFGCSMITGFSNQYFSVKKIFNKYWNILKNDRILGPAIPDKPVVLFRGAPSLRHKLAPNVINPPNVISFFQTMKGFFPCRKCNICKVNQFQGRRIESFQSTQTLKSYPIDSFITCSSDHVIYLIQCPCTKQYIGRTKREVHVRLEEHVGNIRRGYPKHNLSKHYDICHKRNLEGTLFVPIVKLQPHWRGINKVRSISRIETQLIFNMKSYIPHGLNVEWDVNSFINNS